MKLLLVVAYILIGISQIFNDISTYLIGITKGYIEWLEQITNK